ALKQAGAEGPPVNDRPAQAEAVGRRPVKDAAPLAIAAAVELVRVFELQQRLGLAVGGLLAEVGARVLPTVVPDESARRERDPVAGLPQPPADIHVVAGLPVE